jgi:hypothetical protein
MVGRHSEQEIRHFLARHDAFWDACDFDGVASLWDECDAAPVLIAEEYREPVRGWPALHRHWGRLSGRLRQAEMSTEIVDMRELGDAELLLVLLQEWRLVGVETDEPRRGRTWVTALARRREDDWHFFHHMEASASP